MGEEDKGGKGNRDHREVNRDVGSFDFDPLVGPGMPIWLEHGCTLKGIISDYVNGIQRKHGIRMVSTPELGRKELYVTSGHWDHYRENMFPELTLDGDDSYILRPMTCPHHILLYKKGIWHENNMPVAYGENARLYRYESSGGLLGLERTRCMELIDTHVFCGQGQVRDALDMAWKIIGDIGKAFNIQYDSVILSLRDINNGEKFYGDDELWVTSEGVLQDFLGSMGVSLTKGIGDAAFYGPKIDFQIRTRMGRVITISTIQLDFLLPRKFGLTYQSRDGQTLNPIMVHVGIIGTLERFISYLLERDNGWLPFWLSPVQVIIMPIKNDLHLGYARELLEILRKRNIRGEIDDGDISLGKKIARAITRRIYAHAVIGDREICRPLNPGDWDNIMSLFTPLRGDLRGTKLSDEEYPEDHPNAPRWNTK